jgi:pilus assembly protein Flp/PilA
MNYLQGFHSGAHSARRNNAHPDSWGEVTINMLKLFINTKLAIARMIEENDGQGLTEYALILALIAIVAVVALTFLGGKVTSALSTVANSVNT